MPVLKKMFLVLALSGMLSGMLLLAPSGLFAVSCADLGTPEKIRAFVRLGKEANPLWRETLSAHLEVSACERDGCAKAKRKERRARIRHINLVRRGENRRAFVAKGPGAPQCSVSRGGRDFLCAECRFGASTACRSVARTKGPSRIEGTNIDTTDFDLVIGEAFTSVCRPLPKAPKYLQIVSKRKSGDSPFDTIVSFYEKKRAVPITINYLAEGVLRKVYRFFPKYYAKVGGQWVATIIRVRSTQGSEKKYVFETQIRIRTNRAKQYLIYLDPGKDPALRGASLDDIFNPN